MFKCVILFSEVSVLNHSFLSLRLPWWFLFRRCKVIAVLPMFLTTTTCHFWSMQWNFVSQVNHPTNTNWACISLAEVNTKDKMHPKQTGIEVDYSAGLTQHHQGIDPVSDNVYELQISGSHQMQKTSNQVFIHCFILNSMYWSETKLQNVLMDLTVPIAISLLCIHCC